MSTITTLIDEPARLDLDIGSIQIIRGISKHDELDNLDFEHSGHTGFASSSELEAVRRIAEGKSGSLTLPNYNTLLSILGITPSSPVVYSDLDLQSTTITYGGNTYTLQNGFTFYIVEANVPDYWVSVDNMKVYREETDLTSLTSRVHSVESIIGDDTLETESQTISGAINELNSKVQIDSTPTQSSTNLVSSGGVYTYVENAIQDAITTTLNTSV